MGIYTVYLLLIAIWNVVLFYGKDLGISAVFFVVPLLVYYYNLLKKHKKIKNICGLLFMIPIVLLSLTYFLYDNPIFNDLNIIVIFVLFILMFIFTIKPVYNIKKVISNFFNIIFEPLSFIGTFLKESKKDLKGRVKLSNDAKRLIKSLLIVIPIVLIVLLLLSKADSLFNELFSNLIGIFEDIIDYIFSDLIGKVFVGLLLFVFIGINSYYLINYYGTRKDVVKEVKKRDLIPLKLLVGILDIIYVIFDYIQIKELVLHDSLTRYTYSTFARQGFFELLVVIIINITIIVIAKKLQTKENTKEYKFIDTMCIIMIFLTTIIIVSSFMRMNLYVSAFGYTTSRLLVYSSLVVMSLALIPTVIHIFKPETKILRSYMIIVVCVYTIINYLSFDYIIAYKNINRYYDTKKIDLDYLENYGYDNVPLLMMFYDRVNDNQIKTELSDYFVRLGDEEGTFFELNISKYTGKKLISEFKEKHFLNNVDYNRMIEESDRYWEEEKNY